MKWIWYLLLRNILPLFRRYVQDILEVERRFPGTLSQFDRITCKYGESKIKR
ncbi:hypothetical protein Golax_004543 [Gossypium laxum]|uniref:Uncharacterized protein n=1 Tax=Gossypium laxum TaxID=34288 RepID=A0A7J9AZS6_9ROSI|nr:hypothetical protein [Gossypium laxum]